MEQVVFNSTVNGTLQSFFALLVIVVVVNAFVIWSRRVRAGGLPTTEVPRQESHLVQPSDFLATAEEKEAVREWEPPGVATGVGRSPMTACWRWHARCAGASVSSPGRPGGTTTSPSARTLGEQPMSRREFERLRDDQREHLPGDGRCC